MIDPNLIFDLGLHKGEDSEFYLRKGFRVIGVDANAELCEAARERLAPYVTSGQLTIVNKAVAKERGTITFYRNEAFSIWGTADPVWAERNERLGTPSTELQVSAVPLKDLVEEYGIPYFLKIDIEGMDLVALQSLRGAAETPKYVSIESDKVSFANLRREFATLQELGYQNFKIVPQHLVEWQRPRKPAQEGLYVDFRFEHGSSGLFGEEAPGEWMGAEQAIEKYKTIFLRYHLVGDDPLIRSRLIRRFMRLMRFRAGWYDTHARR